MQWQPAAAVSLLGVSPSSSASACVVGEIVEPGEEEEAAEAPPRRSARQCESVSLLPRPPLGVAARAVDCRRRRALLQLARERRSAGGHVRHLIRAQAGGTRRFTPGGSYVPLHWMRMSDGRMEGLTIELWARLDASSDERRRA